MKNWHILLAAAAFSLSGCTPTAPQDSAAEPAEAGAEAFKAADEAKNAANLVSGNIGKNAPELVGFTLEKPVPPMRRCSTSEFIDGGGETICWRNSGEAAEGAAPTILPDGSYMLRFPKHMIPNGVEEIGSMIIIEGVLQQLRLSIDGLRFDEKLLSLLKEKYGEPYRIEETSQVIKSGERLPSSKAWWKYSNGTIFFDGMFTQSGSGQVILFTPKGHEWLERGNGQNASSF